MCSVLAAGWQVKILLIQGREEQMRLRHNASSGPGRDMVMEGIWTHLVCVPWERAVLGSLIMRRVPGEERSRYGQPRFKG